MPSPHHHLIPGDLIKIVGGPLLGMQGIVTHYEPNSRILISISLSDRTVLVEMEGEWAVAV